MNTSRDLPVLSVATPFETQPYATLPQHYAHPGIGLTQLLSILRAHLKVTALITVACVALAALLSMVLPKTYKATATLMVDYEVNDPLVGREFPTALMDSYMSTQLQLITSPAVLLPVIEKLKLTQDEYYTAGYDGEEDGPMLAEYVLHNLRKKLVVQQGEWGSQLIYITHAARNAMQAAQVSNTIANVYAEQKFIRISGPASERATRYHKQLDGLKKNVDTAQERLTEFRQANGLIEATEARVDVDMERLTNLEQRLLEAQEMRRQAELRTLGDPDSRDSVMTSNAIQELRARQAEQQGKLAEIGATLGPRHPEILELRSQIAATQRSIDGEMRLNTGNTHTQIQSARSLEAQLRAAAAAERQRLLASRKLQAEASRYELELESAQTMYKQALDHSDTIALASDGGYNNVFSVSPASPPLKPSQPKPALNVLIGLFAGTFLGFLAPLGYEFYNRRVRCRDDLDRDFGLPVLVELDRLGRQRKLASEPSSFHIAPDVRTASAGDAAADGEMAVRLIRRCGLSPAAIDAIVREQQANRISFADAALRLGCVSESDIEAVSDDRGNATLLYGNGVKLKPGPQLVLAHDPYHHRSETIRALRTELLLRHEDDSKANVLAVISPCPGEGRSLLAAELAIAFSQLGQRTLLVDADLREPGQHLLFGADNQQGLAQAIADQGPPDLHPIENLPQLSLLCAGAMPPNPLELLSGGRFRTMVEQWRGRYRHVVIDTPAVGVYSDALAVATAVGRVLLLSRAQHTPYQETTELLRRLAATQSQILGAVISHH